MNRKRILLWETAGVVVISLLGSFLHFVFDLAGEWPPVALVASVNESVWEHLKLAFWPALMYAFVEWPFFRRSSRHFWTAKAVGILAMPLVITSIFYGYTVLVGKNILWLDISLFFVAVAVGQAVSCWILLRRSISSVTRIPAMALLALMIAAFSLLTFLPPRSPLFRDPRTGRYGISR